MNNYFKSLEKIKSVEKEPKPILPPETIRKVVIGNETIIVLSQEEIFKQQKQEPIVVLEKKQVDVEKEYTAALKDIITKLSLFKTQGEVRFFSGEKIHAKRLEWRLKNIGYDIKIMIYPCSQNYCIDWKLVK